METLVPKKQLRCPGGIADDGARVVAEQLQKRYGQAVGCGW